MSAANKLSASQEDYMEAIFHIIAGKKVARARDIATQLKVSRASVTEALKILAKKSLIHYAPYEVITMTDKGRLAAQDVVQRHKALKDFFINILAVDEALADLAACRVEHAAPPEIIRRLAALMDFLENSGPGGQKLLQDFGRSLT
ncbi:MAG: metal-dependent transcriptional regulator [Deltaproteobacteria bacterium]|nr:metal-dependent transcriptional regulator [Deltaproteobacteria bacterium]